MSARLPRKRARTDADEEPMGAEPDPFGDGDAASSPGQASQQNKDEELWFEDGTVILHAGDAELRVYRGLLEARSSVLKELFAQSHPTRTVMIDGQHFTCPVVRLTDTIQDLRHVLRVCMPKHARRYAPFERKPMLILTSQTVCSLPLSPLPSTWSLPRSG